MPRPALTQSTRSDITGALLHLIGQGGFEAVSIRTVAEQAGCSAGLVQRQFGTKDELIAHAAAHAAQQTQARLADLMGGVPADTPVRARIAALLQHLLRLDGDTHAPAVIWLNILARASTDPILASQLRAYHQTTLDSVVKLIQSGQHCGELRRDLDPGLAAMTVLSTLDGLMIHKLIGTLTPARAAASLEVVLDAVLTADKQ